MKLCRTHSKKDSRLKEEQQQQQQQLFLQGKQHLLGEQMTSMAYTKARSPG